MQRDSFHGPMWRRGAGKLLAVAGVLWLAGPTAAQKAPAPGLSVPRLLTVMPSGGRTGTTVEVTVGGQDLADPTGLLFSAPGIQAEWIAPAADAKPPAAEPTRGSGKRADPRNAVTAMHRFKVTIPPGTSLGLHDVRFVGKTGVSNPRAFMVGDFAEVTEKEPNNDVDQAQRVALNTTVNGVISAATDVDYFVFAGKKGQRVVLSCLASSIDSRLLPGLELYDQAGRQLAFNKNYQGTDALTDCTLPGDGDYYVRLYEFTYTRGGPEYFYRLSISTAPWIDAVHPPMVEPGKTARLTVYGRNLPGGQADPAAVVDGRVLEKLAVTVEVPNDPRALQRLAFAGHVAPSASGLDGFEYRLRNDSGSSNPFLLTFARAPVVLDNEANDTPETAQEINLPCEVAGRIEKRGDRDWYAFTARKGEVYSVEVFGERLGAPVDLFLLLRSSDGKKQLADLDDTTDLLSPTQFFTRSEDPPRFRFEVPADGRYLLLIGSREASVEAGPRDFYRLRITREEPDFRLVVMPQAANSPDACVLRAGGRQYYTVFVWRLDGWNGQITLTGAGLPPGVACPAQVIAPGAQQATLVLSAKEDVAAWTGPIAVKGAATIDGRAVVRDARAATITWPVPQVNIPTVSRLDRSLVLAVRPDKAPFAVQTAVEQVTAAPGEKVTIPVKIVRRDGDFKSAVQLTVLNQPLNPANRNRNQAKGMPAAKDDASVVVDVNSKALPGTYTLVVRGEASLTPGPKNRPNNKAVLVEASAPITLTVRPAQLARLTVQPESATVEVGKETEVTVRVARLGDFKGKFKLQLVLPPKVKGISAPEVTIPAGKDEAKVVLKVARDATAEGRTDLTMRAITAGKDGTAVTQDVKFTVKVVK